MATWNKSLGIRSAEALCDLSPARLAVGHGNTLENPVAAMERAIAEAKRHVGKDGHATQEAY